MVKNFQNWEILNFQEKKQKVIKYQANKLNFWVKLFKIRIKIKKKLEKIRLFRL